MKLLLTLLQKLTPGAIIAFALTEILNTTSIYFRSFLAVFFVVQAIIILNILLKNSILFINYKLFEKKKTVDNMAKILISLNFPDPKLYNFDQTESIAGELYFRNIISDDNNLSKDVINQAREFNVFIETLRGIGEFGKLFLFLKIYKDTVKQYSKNFKD